MTLQTVLYVLAALCFFLAAIGPAWVVVTERVNLVALGLFLLTLTLVIK
jgi:hypothetical protein